MVITTFNFFVFVALTAIIYFFCVPKKYQWCVLLLASYVFYAFAGFSLFVFIISTTLTVYLGALWIGKINELPTSPPENARLAWYLRVSKKWVVALVAIGNFGVLASFKWWNAIAEAVNIFLLGDSDVSLPYNSWLLPLGISFYTFQAIGYLIDVYRGKMGPEKNPARFALFVSFFPQLVQGPISRHSELAEQLYASRRFDYGKFRRGVQLMIWGLFKKLVIADRLVIMVSTIFSGTGEYDGLYILIGAITHALWVYADFSGGVDIARGVGQIFGIEMPLNFLRPFFSSSLPEYWRRWHISLNNWWRDYLFYPLVLSKPMTKISRFTRQHISPSLGRVIGVYIGINVVRIINAMWHGANAYYIANGLFIGIIMVLAMVLDPLAKKIIALLRIDTDCFSWRLFQIVRTFLIMCLGRVFLAVGGARSGLLAMASIVRDFNPWILNYDDAVLFAFDPRDARIVIFSLLVVLVVEILQEKGLAMRETLERQNIAFQWLVMLGGIFAILMWGMYGHGYDAAAFVYMGF